MFDVDANGPITFTPVAFDPLQASHAQWQTLHAFRRLRADEDYPGEPLLSDADFEHMLKEPHPLQQTRRVLVCQDEKIAGILILHYRRQGSPGCEDFAGHVGIAGGVARQYRRRGAGTLLLAALASFMAHSGKTIATATTHLGETEACLSHIGATCKFRKAENRALLDRVDWPLLQAWAEAPDLASRGLEWEVHAGRVPTATLAPLMAPLTDLINACPIDDLNMPALRYELEAYDSWYAEMDRRGGDHFLVLLRHGDGVAAVCDASWDQRFPERLHQQFTGVGPAWRNQGLAKAVKARMLELVRTLHPEVTTVVTYNANANAPMLSINRRLGFEVHRAEGTYQIELATLQAYLDQSRALNSTPAVP